MGGNALKQGFNLEAITLVESLVSGRLESRLTKLLSKDFSYKELSKLIYKTREKETDERLLEPVSIDLDNWRKNRNFAIHKMAKLEDGDTRSLEDQINALGLIANNGYELYKKINARVKSIKKIKHKNGF